MPERQVRHDPRMQYNRPIQRRRPRPSATQQIRQRIPWRYVWVIGGGVVGVWAIWSAFNVQDVSVTATQKDAKVKENIQRLLDDSARQSNLLTLQPDALAMELMAIDPELKDVTVSRRWPDGLAVSVTQKEPALGWSTGNQRYLLDRDGTIIGEFPDGSKLPIIIDGSNLPVKTGQQVVTARFITFSKAVAAGLPGVGLAVREVRVQDTTFDLYVVVNKPYRLLFDTSRPAEDQLKDLKTVLASLTAQKKVPTDYIDLRISGKAYYK